MEVSPSKPIDSSESAMSRYMLRVSYSEEMVIKVCLDGHIGWSLAQLTLYRIGHSHFVTISSIDYQGMYK